MYTVAVPRTIIEKCRSVLDLHDLKKQISQKLHIVAGKMYKTICVEWAKDYFSLGLM